MHWEVFHIPFPLRLFSLYLNISSKRDLNNYQCNPFYEQHEKLMKLLVEAQSYYLNFLHINPNLPSELQRSSNVFLLSAKISNTDSNNVLSFPE